MSIPSLQDIIRKYFRLPRKKLWIAALKLQRWPVTWWDEKLEKKRNKEKLRKEKIARLYPKKKGVYQNSKLTNYKLIRFLMYKMCMSQVG